MILYLKTVFDPQMRKLNAKKISFEKKNSDFVNTNDFKEYADIENTGIFHIKISPHEIKRWYDSLSKETKEKNYIIVWDNDWISLPGKAIEMISTD